MGVYNYIRTLLTLDVFQEVGEIMVNVVSFQVNISSIRIFMIVRRRDGWCITPIIFRMLGVKFNLNDSNLDNYVGIILKPWCDN